jgi:hypothetical protein
MTQQHMAVPYGLWPSPLQPRHLAEGLRLSDVAWDSDGVTLVWHEGRSDRGVLVCLPAGGDAPRDLTTDLSVRARVGYGGGDFTVAGGEVYFVEASGRLYRQSLARIISIDFAGVPAVRICKRANPGAYPIIRLVHAASGVLEHFCKPPGVWAVLPPESVPISE